MELVFYCPDWDQLFVWNSSDFNNACTQLPGTLHAYCTAILQAERKPATEIWNFILIGAL